MDKPAPKRCKATSKQSGKPCGKWARPGYDVCEFHGAGRPGGNPPGRPPVHGLASMKLRHLADEGRARIAELERDPELLDIRRTVAASQYLVEQHAPIDPPEPLVKATARYRFKLGADVEPSAEQLDLVRLDLANIGERMLERHGAIQGDAHRQQTANKLILEVAMPVMRAFAEDLMAVLERHVDRETMVKVKADFATVTARTVGRLSEATGHGGRE